MILRELEATDDADFVPLLDLAKRNWTANGIPFEEWMDGDEQGERFRRLGEQGQRIIVLEEGGSLLAALGAHPIETDRGPGYEVVTFVVDPDLPAARRLELLDAVSLYACNIVLAEGRTVAMSRPVNPEGRILYGRDRVGMEYDRPELRGQQIRDIEGIVEDILKRHPEWRTSLSFMTPT